MKKALCGYCLELVDYDIEEQPAIKTIRGEDYPYNELITYCKECHKEINVSEILDENIDRIDRAYRYKAIEDLKEKTLLLERELNIANEKIKECINPDKLIEILSNYFNIGDSDTYQLTRVKEAFNVGTMTFDDFVEWEEENVVDLADYIIKKLEG